MTEVWTTEDGYRIDVKPFAPRPTRFIATSNAYTVDDCVIVRICDAEGRELARTYVLGREVYDPDAINRLGTRGAIRILPPADDTIREAAHRLLSKVRQRTGADNPPGGGA